MSGFEVKFVLATILAAFGIAAPLPHFAAGLFMAVAGAYFMAIWFPENTKRELRHTIGAAMLLGAMTAIAHQHVAVLRDFPLQLVMATSGFLSRFAVLALYSAGGAIADMIPGLLRRFFGGKDND